MGQLTLIDAIKKHFSKKVLDVSESKNGEIEFIVSAESNVEILTELKTRNYNHLADLTAYDKVGKHGRFHVVYELISMTEKQRLRVVASGIDDSDPSIKTVSELWAGANWLEREIFDMYGIVFKKHPDHRRILMPDSFKGHPLRKDFIVDYRQEFNDPNVDKTVFDPFGHTVVDVDLKSKSKNDKGAR